MSTLDLDLLNNVLVPVFVLEPDSSGNLVYVAFNNTALDIAKFSPSDYLGRTALQLYADEYGKHAYKQHLQAYKTGKKSTYILQLPLNGKVRYIRTHLKPTLDSTGQVIRLTGTSTEVSAEHELEEIRAQSRALTKELEEFIYLAAHDLRSPMRQVRAFADILREDFVDLGDGKLHAIDMLEKLSIQAMSQVESVLKHAAITGIEASIETFNLSELCNDILKSLDPANSHKLSIENTALYGDRLATQVILQNLIDNALKHNTDTAVSLTISAKKAETEFFSVTVADNGRGISNPEKLFDSDGSDRSKSGFGLLAVRRLIKARGGKIYAESLAKGTGLMVTFTLPGSLTSS